MNASKEYPNIPPPILSRSMEDLGYEDYILKLSNGKCFFNRRYLILHDGIIAYYSEKPSVFLSQSASQAKSKGKVHVLDTEIKRVDPAFAKKKNNPYMFQISFTTSGKNNKVFWIFAVTTENILVQWLEAFERCRNPAIIIEEEKEDGYESGGVDKESEMKEEKEKAQREEKFKKKLELERQRSEKKQKKIEELKKREEFSEEVKRKEDLGKEIKRKEEANKEIKRKADANSEIPRKAETIIEVVRKEESIQKVKHKEEASKYISPKQEANNELKRKEESNPRNPPDKSDTSRLSNPNKILETFWDYRFQSLLTSFLSSPSAAQIDQGLPIFHLLSSFLDSSKRAAKLLITDQHLPLAQRRFQPLKNSTYLYQNLLLHLSPFHAVPEDYKHLGHEFRARDLLQEAVFFLSRSEPSFRLRLPLSCIVDFRGFRALVTAVVPLDSELTVLHGLKKPNYYLSEPSLYGNLSSLARVLNIRPQVLQWEHGKVPLVHLSVFTQIHESFGYSRIEELEGASEGDSVMYVTHTSEILPIDMDFGCAPRGFMERLRPEYLSDCGVPLSANACINYTREAIEEDDLEICEASHRLRTDKIRGIVDLLDSLAILPIDSKEMTQAMHANGINCRYLGLIACRTAMQHVRDICIVEILARTCKNFLLQQLAELMMESSDETQIDITENIDRNQLVSSGKKQEAKHFEENLEEPEGLSFGDINIQNLLYRKDAFLARYKKVLGWPNYKSLKSNSKDIKSPRENPDMEVSLKECIVDYLNLIFGVGEESEIFWQEILARKASACFNIPEEKIDKNQINLHALLHALVFHCGLQLFFSKETMLGQVENPFTPQSLEKINEKTKVLNLKGIESLIISTRLESVDHSDLSLESLLISLEISKILNPDKDNLGDPVLLSDIGEIMLERSDFDAAIEYARDSLQQINPFHAFCVKSFCILIRAMMGNSMQGEALQCYDQALAALDYHWGPSHPLHCTLHSTLAYAYLKKDLFEEALVLYKNSLVCSLRALGPNHPHTAEVYLELGSLYTQQGSLNEATQAIEKGFTAYEGVLGKKSLVTAMAGVKLAQLYSENGRFGEAMQLISDGISAHEGVLRGLGREDYREGAEKIARNYGKIEEVLQRTLEVAKTSSDQGIVKGIMELIEKVKRNLGRILDNLEKS